MKKKICLLFLIMGATMLLINGTTILNAEPDGGITVTILYDNYVHKEGTESDWGFSCLIEGTEKNILFDTGTKPGILLENIRKLGVEKAANNAQLVILSHNHYDHTGGLWTVLQQNAKRNVFIPESFPDDFVQKVKEAGAKAVKVEQPRELCKKVFLTGQMGTKIKEQSLILETKQGLVLITGCSHPGIVEIVKKAIEVRKKKVFMVFGGFHLMDHSAQKVGDIVTQLKELGVQKVGATHCTGEDSIALIKKGFGTHFIDMGVGKTLKL